MWRAVRPDPKRYGALLVEDEDSGRFGRDLRGLSGDGAAEIR